MSRVDVPPSASSRLEFVTLVLHPVGSVDFPHIGVPDLRWRGEPLSFPTTGPYKLEFGNDRLATLIIEIPVIVEIEPPA